MRSIVRWVLAGATVAMFAITAAKPTKAQNPYEMDPFLGKNQFPQYRNLSGLAGGGYGTDAQGHHSLTGPTAFSTPTAYVLGHDGFFGGAGGVDYKGVFSLDGNRVNGSTVGTYGHTFGQFNFAVTEFIKSSALDSALNLQMGLIPLRRRRLGVSLGVQDLLGLGGSAGAGRPTDRYSSQSVFFALTYPIDTGGHPVYLSGGLERTAITRASGRQATGSAGRCACTRNTTASVLTKGCCWRTISGAGAAAWNWTLTRDLCAANTSASAAASDFSRCDF